MSFVPFYIKRKGLTVARNECINHGPPANVGEAHLTNFTQTLDSRYLRNIQQTGRNRKSCRFLGQTHIRWEVEAQISIFFISDPFCGYVVNWCYRQQKE